MGTGMMSSLLDMFSEVYPRYHTSLHILAIIFFVLNFVLFLIISIMSILRYTLYPHTWTLMLRHPVQSLFLGTVPMAFATLINSFVKLCVPAWEGPSIYVAWGFWWVDAAGSLACCVGLAFQMYVLMSPLV
jgi:tellurite resistance protein TehA-like permease